MCADTASEDKGKKEGSMISGQVTGRDKNKAGGV
jgi:hypothetical protein